MINAILRMFNGITENDFLLQDDGDGVYIKQWNWNEPQPDMADVIAESLKGIPPTVVTMEQTRLALFDIGLLDAVESEMAKKDKKANITWNYATEVKRDSLLVQDVKTVLGLTETDLDNLFTLASTL